ncbi:MAG: glycoside hydrolase family 2 TIM barrel-domain containing protein [Phycisphaerae bacterium]
MRAVATLLLLPLATPSAAADPLRETRDVNAGWRFWKGDLPAASQPAFDDAAWQTVDLPHTWNAVDGQDGGGDYYRGPAWYRTTLEIPNSWSGRRIFLHFGAASIVADVYLDGQHLGEHCGAFAAFRFEITSRVSPGRRANLAVRVDNGRFEDVPPWSADFTFFGGLYRGVSLIATPPICIWPLDYASSGVYFRPTRVNAEAADVEVLTLVSNGLGERKSAKIAVNLTDATGKSVATSEKMLEIEAGALARVSQIVSIAQPRRWQGVRDPYLYRLTVRVGENEAIEVPLGLRAFRVDPERGFLLNDEPYPIHGVNRHQDRLDKGWAIGPREHEEDFALIREMGCTGVRLAHYQHDSYAYELCDRSGLVVWAEIPLVDRVFDTPAFRENARQQLMELIRQNFNHPSICFWGVHNEITAPWAKGPDATAIVGELAVLAATEDSTRPSTCAACGPYEHAANWKTALTAFNNYFGWYHDEPEAFAAWIDGQHREHAGRCIGVSEYGAGASIAQHESPAKKPRHDGPWHPEEWQAQVHEAHWQAMRTREFLWCTFVWNMFDFASDGRKEGDHPGRNDKGLVTFDRKTRKDAFYFYKAQWSDEPFVHITSRRYQPRSDAVTTVKVYSNCAEVELLVNGASRGRLRSENGIFKWPSQTLTPGDNEIRAIAQRDQQTLSDSCSWKLDR